MNGDMRPDNELIPGRDDLDGDSRFNELLALVLDVEKVADRRQPDAIVHASIKSAAAKARALAGSDTATVDAFDPQERWPVCEVPMAPCSINGDGS